MTGQPRTVAGRAAVSGLRPHLQRALSHTILAIEAEAIAPYVEALREADRVLEDLAARDATSTWDVTSHALVQRAEAARELMQALLAEEERG